MKKSLLYIFPFLLLSSLAWAASQLPPCEGRSPDKWTNCFGTFRGASEDGGGKYVGEWKDGRFSGQGTFTYFNNEKYVGQWKNDLKHGPGAYIYPDGKVKKGLWKDGKFVKSTQ